MKFKILIAQLMCSKIVGTLIKRTFPSIMYLNEIKISTTTPNISSKALASIFWGLYERAEAKFILKYLDEETNVIELGSSLGVISCLIAKKVDNVNKKIICLEPNPDFKSDIQSNLDLNNLENVKIISKAYHYSEDFVPFKIGDVNVAGKVVPNTTNMTSNNIITVPATSLKQLLISENFNDIFTLVSDIEGAEIGLIINECKSLSKCKKIIIETHETSYNGVKYNPEDIKQIIIKNGFNLIDSKGSVYCFENSQF